MTEKEYEEYEDWSEKIIKKYPNLFRYMICKCFENGPGWKSVQEWLVKRLNDVNERFKKYHVQCYISQVKEKFGTLRVYYDILFDKHSLYIHFLDKFKGDVLEKIYNVLDKKVTFLIRKAEEKCYNVCENCGKEIGTPESPRIETEGWIRYICEDCDSKIKKEYKSLNMI